MTVSKVHMPMENLTRLLSGGIFNDQTAEAFVSF